MVFCAPVDTPGKSVEVVKPATYTPAEVTAMAKMSSKAVPPSHVACGAGAAVRPGFTRAIQPSKEPMFVREAWYPPVVKGKELDSAKPAT